MNVHNQPSSREVSAELVRKTLENATLNDNSGAAQTTALHAVLVDPKTNDEKRLQAFQALNEALGPGQEPYRLSLVTDPRLWKQAPENYCWGYKFSQGETCIYESELIRMGVNNPNLKEYQDECTSQFFARPESYVNAESTVTTKASLQEFLACNAEKEGHFTHLAIFRKLQDAAQNLISPPDLSVKLVEHNGRPSIYELWVEGSRVYQSYAGCNVTSRFDPITLEADLKNAEGLWVNQNIAISYSIDKYAIRLIGTGVKKREGDYVATSKMPLHRTRSDILIVDSAPGSGGRTARFHLVLQALLVTLTQARCVYDYVLRSANAKSSHDESGISPTTLSAAIAGNAKFSPTVWGRHTSLATGIAQSFQIVTVSPDGQERNFILTGAEKGDVSADYKSRAREGVLAPIQDLYRQSVAYMNANEKTVLHARMFDDAMQLGGASIGALFGVEQPTEDKFKAALKPSTQATMQG